MRRVVLLFVAACAACAGEAEEAATVSVTDSAGIAIVDNGTIDSRIAFVVGEPVFRVGWGDQERIFEQVYSGALMSGGGAAIGDAGAGELVVLSPAGEVSAVLGGPGEGPDEIGSLASVTVLPGDTIIVEDDGNARINFMHDGAWVGQYRIQDGMAAFSHMAIGAEDRSLIMQISFYRPRFEEEWLRMPIVRHALGTQDHDTLFTYDFARRIDGETPNPFRPFSGVAATAGGVVVAWGSRPQLERYDLSGVLRQITRWGEERRPLTDDLWAEYEAYRYASDRSRTDEELAVQLANYRGAVDEPLPYFRTLKGDDEGRAWMSEYSMDRNNVARYRVFDVEGRWLGWVDMPPHYQVLDIRAGRILAIERDDFDVEAISVRPFR